MKLSELKHLEIKFETADILPLHLFTSNIACRFWEDFIDVEIIYRDRLTDEEILEEGFNGEENLAGLVKFNAWHSQFEIIGFHNKRNLKEKNKILLELHQ
jgi:hypothetical protein